MQEKNFLTIALPKGKLFGLSTELFGKVGIGAEGLHEKSRKLIITNEAARLKFIITKTADVPTYVEYGAADLGVIGKDVIAESGKDVYELLDLGGLRQHARRHEISTHCRKIFRRAGYANGIYQAERFH